MESKETQKLSSSPDLPSLRILALSPGIFYTHAHIFTQIGSFTLIAIDRYTHKYI